MAQTIKCSLKLFAILLVLFPFRLVAQSDSALAGIRELAGSWEGTFEWTGARTGSGKMSATYYLTGNESAVVENLMIESKPVMTTVYHLDGDDLRMTHYCAAQNQPRLKATSIDSANRRISFDFVDITNLPDPEGGHVHKFEIHLKNKNEITLKFTFLGKGQESYERINLTRVPNP